jgi:hypothetical protein
MRSKIRLDVPTFQWLPPDKGGKKYTVLGRKASSFEWNFATALDKIGLEYIFQVDYLGGRRLKGGFIVDFLVKTAPLSTPCWINGDYWHSGKTATADKLKQAQLYQLTSHECNMPKTFWGKDVETVEAALAAVRRELL